MERPFLSLSLAVYSETKQNKKKKKRKEAKNTRIFVSVSKRLLTSNFTQKLPLLFRDDPSVKKQSE